MKLYSLLTEDQIQLQLEADNLEDAIRQMLKPQEAHLKSTGAKRLLQALM